MIKTALRWVLNAVCWCVVLVIWLVVMVVDYFTDRPKDPFDTHEHISDAGLGTKASDQPKRTETK